MTQEARRNPAARMRAAIAIALAFVLGAMLLPAAWADVDAEPAVSDVPAPAALSAGSPSPAGAAAPADAPVPDASSGDSPDSAMPDGGAPDSAIPDGADSSGESPDSVILSGARSAESKDLPSSDGETAASEYDSEDASEAEDPDDPETGDPDRPYSLRLIADLGGGQPRGQDVVLGEHDGVYLLGFPDGESISEAELFYSETASWVQRDVAMGAAEGEAPSGEPGPVAAGDDPLTLLDDAPASPAPATQKPLVALIDTGAPDDPAVVGSASFVEGDDPADRNGHATAMLQAMKAEDQDVRVLALKALGDDGCGSASSVYAAIEYAVESGARIINLSLAGYASEGNAAIAGAVSDALASGCVVVAAAGNGGYDAGCITPANISGVFTVGACDAEGNVLDSSNRGDCVDGYVEADSTSLAAARVSGWLSGDGVGEDWRKRAVPERSASFGDSDGDEHSHIDKSEGGVSVAAASGEALTIWKDPNPSSSHTTYSWWNTKYTKNHLFLNSEDKGSGYLYTSTSGAKNRDSSKLLTLGSKVSWIEHTRTNGWLLNGIWTAPVGGTQIIGRDGTVLQNWVSLTKTGGSYRLYYHYAQWDVEIVLNDNGGSGGSGNIWFWRTHGYYTTSDMPDSKKMSSLANPVRIPTRTGTATSRYRFTGYYTNNTNRDSDHLAITADGHINTDVMTLTKYNTDASVTLYAGWEEVLSVTLDPQGGSGAYEQAWTSGKGLYLDSDCKLKCGPGLNQYSVGVPTRAGYKFYGYYTSPDGEGTRVIDEHGIVLREQANRSYSRGTTLYAYWKKCVTVTLDDSQGNHEYEKILIVPDDGIFLQYGDRLDGPRRSSVWPPSKAGYVCSGFYENEDGTGTRFLDDQCYLTSKFRINTFTEDVTLYAAYTQAYQVELYPDWLTLEDSELELEYERGSNFVFTDGGNQVCLDALLSDSLVGSTSHIEVPTCSHYKFGGYYLYYVGDGSDVDWSRESLMDAAYGDNPCLIDSNGRVTGAFKPSELIDYACLVAKWNPYTIVLDDQGGSGGSGHLLGWWGFGTFHDTKKQKELTVEINAVDIPSKGTAIFRGYYTEPRGQGTCIIGEDGLLVNELGPTYFDSDSTLYAFWEGDSDPVLLPITGGVGESLLLLWGAAVAVVAAAGVLVFRSLRRRPSPARTRLPSTISRR